MNYSTENSDWKITDIGRWRGLNGKVLTVGKQKYGDKYWVCVDGKLLEGMSYSPLRRAQTVAECYVPRHKLGGLSSELDGA